MGNGSRKIGRCVKSVGFYLAKTLIVLWFCFLLIVIAAV